MPLAVARSAYLEQVRRIAPSDPPGLRDRDAELAELARFCLAAGGGAYTWWRAGPWAGKSALLSTFVLCPPPEVRERVRIVSFFITARLAAQDTREAFIDVLLEQLASLLSRPLPTVLPEATREAHLLDLMSQAAGACQGAGGRLVLVVDGLDEDRGVTTGPDAHSIAGLLPARPPAGMRVIVAGRPDPRVPDDVPDWHPLRDPAIIRPLPGSPHAHTVQRLARQELQRLLHGNAAEREVLGLLTAARGGLSSPDLAELAGIPLWEVEDILCTVAGRTFSCRPSSYHRKGRPDVYLLGHEELQAEAVRYLGGRLAGYRKRLHAWVAGYRAAGWPAGTPEYLLSGYFRLLQDLDDLPRMIECAGDMARHDIMFRLTGGDAAALAEARATLDRIAVQDTPDLTSALALAGHRDHLARRNAIIPLGLPSVWVTLGEFSRARAMAASMTDPGQQARALADLAAALAQAGQYQDAATMAAQAETKARSVAHPDLQRDVLADVAVMLADVAVVLADAERYQQASAIVAQAETMARSAADPKKPGRQPRILADIAVALSDAGQYQQATAIAARAETAARSITHLGSRAIALADAAAALALAGQREQAAAILAEAEAAADSITDTDWQATALARIAAALAEAGQYQQAESVACSIHAPVSRATALIGVAVALADAGQYQPATTIAVQAATAARSIPEPTNPYLRAGVLADVAVVLARAGQYQQAETVACLITGPGSRAGALAGIARVLAKDGRYQQAAVIATQAETTARSIADQPPSDNDRASDAAALAQVGHYDHARTVARSITDLNWQAIALADVAAALARAGQCQQAETVARSITWPSIQMRALVDVAAALAQAGRYEQAAAIATQAETTARSMIDPDSQANALTRVAKVLAQAGRYEQAAAIATQAETTARSITNPDWQARALAGVAGVLTQIGRYEQAAVIMAQAESTARSITDPGWQPIALADVAEILAQDGQHKLAVAVACSITEPISQARALTSVVGMLVHPGQSEQAAAIAAQAETVARSITDPCWQARALAYVAAALAKAGQRGQTAANLAQAEAIARSITDPGCEAAALADVAEALARTGRHEQAAAIFAQAEAIARAITDPDRQAGVLIQVAEALTQAGEAHSAARVAAAICAAGKWTDAVRSVLLFGPSPFTAPARTPERQ